MGTNSSIIFKKFIYTVLIWKAGTVTAGSLSILEGDNIQDCVCPHYLH